jgi:hypothetical protein
MDGMKAGAQRVLRVPFEESFGSEGNDSIGLPAATDVVLIIDLIAIF